MTTRQTLPLLFFLIASSCAPLQAASSAAEQAQQAWQKRDQSGETEHAISFWQEAVKGGDTGALIPLTKACGRAVRHAASPAESQRWAKMAREYGDQAVQKNPTVSDAYAAQAEALGQWANAHKGLHSLSLVKQAVAALQKAIELNPKNSYAHMLLAEFYRQSPSGLSVGDKKKALEQAQLAVNAAPQYAINHLALANAYLDLKKKDEGIAELQKIASLPAPADAIPETKADQHTAAALLKTLGVTPEPSHCGDTAGTCTEKQ